MCPISFILILASINAIMAKPECSNDNIVRYRPTDQPQVPRSLKASSILRLVNTIIEKHRRRDPQQMTLPIDGNVKPDSVMNKSKPSLNQYSSHSLNAEILETFGMLDDNLISKSKKHTINDYDNVTVSFDPTEALIVEVAESEFVTRTVPTNDNLETDNTAEMSNGTSKYSTEDSNVEQAYIVDDSESLTSQPTELTDTDRWYESFLAAAHKEYFEKLADIYKEYTKQKKLEANVGKIKITVEDDNDQGKIVEVITDRIFTNDANDENGLKFEDLLIMPLRNKTYGHLTETDKWYIRLLNKTRENYLKELSKIHRKYSNYKDLEKNKHKASNDNNETETNYSKLDDYLLVQALNKSESVFLNETQRFIEKFSNMSLNKLEDEHSGRQEGKIVSENSEQFFNETSFPYENDNDKKLPESVNWYLSTLNPTQHKYLTDVSRTQQTSSESITSDSFTKLLSLFETNKNKEEEVDPTITDLKTTPHHNFTDIASNFKEYLLNPKDNLTDKDRTYLNQVIATHHKYLNMLSDIYQKMTKSKILISTMGKDNKTVITITEKYESLPNHLAEILLNISPNSTDYGVGNITDIEMLYFNLLNATKENYLRELNAIHKNYMKNESSCSDKDSFPVTRTTIIGTDMTPKSKPLNLEETFAPEYLNIPGTGQEKLLNNNKEYYIREFNSTYQKYLQQLLLLNKLFSEYKSVDSGTVSTIDMADEIETNNTEFKQDKIKNYFDELPPIFSDFFFNNTKNLDSKAPSLSKPSKEYLEILNKTRQHYSKGQFNLNYEFSKNTNKKNNTSVTAETYKDLKKDDLTEFRAMDHDISQTDQDTKSLSTILQSFHEENNANLTITESFAEFEPFSSTTTVSVTRTPLSLRRFFKHSLKLPFNIGKKLDRNLTKSDKWCLRLLNSVHSFYVNKLSNLQNSSEELDDNYTVENYDTTTTTEMQKETTAYFENNLRENKAKISRYPLTDPIKYNTLSTIAMTPSGRTSKLPTEIPNEPPAKNFLDKLSTALDEVFLTKIPENTKKDNINKWYMDVLHKKLDNLVNKDNASITEQSDDIFRTYDIVLDGHSTQHDSEKQYTRFEVTPSTYKSKKYNASQNTQGYDDEPIEKQEQSSQIMKSLTNPKKTSHMQQLNFTLPRTGLSPVLNEWNGTLKDVDKWYADMLRANLAKAFKAPITVLPLNGSAPTPIRNNDTNVVVGNTSRTIQQTKTQTADYPMKSKPLNFRPTLSTSRYSASIIPMSASNIHTSSRTSSLTTIPWLNSMVVASTTSSTDVYVPLPNNETSSLREESVLEENASIPQKTTPSLEFTKQDMLNMDEKLKLYQSKYCGKDESPIQDTYPGAAKIEWYPWLGVLLYPTHNDYSNDLTTKVILVQKQIALASATEIKKYPKDYFSHEAKVVLGSNTKDGQRVGILTYNYHPDYNTGQDMSLVLIQLDLVNVNQTITAICPPPQQFSATTKLYAMVTDDDPAGSNVMLYEMQYVDFNSCQNYYNNIKSASSSNWPKHVLCAKAISGSECVWQGGVALVIKQEERWHLLGFGMAGPGCSAPSRYVDYMSYSDWVHKSVARIGRVSITRPDPNIVVIRRVPRHIQRYGSCNKEEVEMELYSDHTDIRSVNPLKHHLQGSRVRLNVTLLANYDYTCIILRADYRPPKAIIEKPKITMKYYCTTPYPICYDAAISQIDFYIVIYFYHDIVFKMDAYGRQSKIIDAKALQKYVNEKYSRPDPF